MKTTRFIVITLATVLVSPAFAACPAPLAGDTPEVLEANRERLICLQRELSEKADDYQVTVDLDNLDRRFDDLQLKQRFNSLQFTPPKVPDF
ncbi:hypothetical protein VW35_12495 [Devosia soli]|uniref:Uncharacterized protein n=2 Tax=Devosia soli TaxID=361041 RepID=A0A0F5L8I5_9HYPH|nr:hypothetical protein VW35_12495 [Devosia soli]